MFGLFGRGRRVSPDYGWADGCYPNILTKKREEEVADAAVQVLGGYARGGGGASSSIASVSLESVAKRHHWKSCQWT